MFILSQHLTAVDVPPLIKLSLESIVLSKHISFLIPMQETKLAEGSSVTSCPMQIFERPYDLEKELGKFLSKCWGISKCTYPMEYFIKKMKLLF